MNSRSSVNESNLVNFSTELSTLNQLDTKDALLTFPFDHLYACHSESDRRQTLQLDKEVEISTHCVIGEDKELVISNTPEVSRLSERITSLESQNKKLKDLLIYHLDLIQQQNELLTKREKLYQGLKLENESLKAKLNRLDRRITVNQKHSVNPPPLVQVPSSTVTSSTIGDNENSPSSQIMLNSFTELLLPDSRTNPLIFDSDLNKSKPFEQDTFELSSNTEADVTSYLSSDLGVPSILDSNLTDEFTMIDNKRTFKKEIKTENRPEALYTVTSNSGNPVIHRIQRNRKRTSSGVGSLNRMTRTPSTKVEIPEPSKLFGEDKHFDRTYSVNKKSKTINTYGKSKIANTRKTTQFTGSLSDRLQLIDTTPTGEDPYQLGEADMREQSPIPKLMLQKTNHGRTKLNSDEKTSRHLYNTTLSEGVSKPSIKFNDRYNLTNTYMHSSEIKTETIKPIILQEGLIEKQESAINWQLFDSTTKPPKVENKTEMLDEPDLDIVKTEPDIDWRMYNPNKPGNETSLCDFSYGETPNFASNIMPSLDSVEFQDLFSSDTQLQLDSTLNSVDYSLEKSPGGKSKRRGARTASMLGSSFLGEEQQNKKMCIDTKRGRKRALSTTGLTKNVKRDLFQKGATQKPKLNKGRASSRGKKSPVPGMVTRKPYYTSVGDPDLSWYLGLDPDVKIEDVDQEEKSKVSTVEVPRWREKPYTSCYTLEGTENLDDKVFEKRHQKLEAEERRQLRWHMRRIREQRHVERLRQRQRDPWGGGGSPAHTPPTIYTLWPQPQRDAAFIEITDVIPVMAFGEIVPALPESDFMLPWVRTSKALKRVKRSKTLH